MLDQVMQSSDVLSENKQAAAGIDSAKIDRTWLNAGFRELDVDYDAATNIFQCRFQYTERPSFTPDVLNDLTRVRGLVASLVNRMNVPVKYFVLASNMPGIFSLGGDLHLFSQLIRDRDRDGLTAYARTCVGEVHANSMSLGLPIVTISLVQGDALGGGFETALSSNVIIAERSAKFGLPEIMFNLFPGMGAYNYIARRTSVAIAERMIMSGRVYTGEELFDMGIVDVLADDGKGDQAVKDYVRKNSSRHTAHRAIYDVRERVTPITLEDLNTITDVWVDTALALRPIDLKMMERLVSAQDRRRSRSLPGQSGQDE